MSDVSVDPKIFETLSEKLDLLAKNIEYLYEASNRIANRDERRGRGNDLPYIMNFDNIKDDIFRGRGFRYYNESSETERENYRSNLERERENNRQDRKEAINKNRENRKELDELRDKRTSLKDKKRHQKNELKSLEAKHRKGEISDSEYAQKRTEIEKDLNETLKELVDNLKKRQTKSSDISKTDSRIQTAKDNIANIDNKLNNLEASYNNDVDEKRNSIINQAWSGMTDKEKARYDNNITQFAEAKSAQHEYNERNDERQEVSRMVQNSGLENTAFGRITQNAINRNQKFDNIKNFGRQLSKEGGAARLSKQLFGAGKGASFATKAFSGLGGIMGKFGKLMGGPVVGGIMMAIDAIKAIAKVAFDAANEWAKINAEMIKMQTEQERIQFEQAKQHLILNTQAEVEKISIAGDLAVKHTEMMSQNFLEGLSIQNEAFVKSMEIGTGAMTMGVAQTAYNAAEASIDQAAKMRKYEVHQGQRGASFEWQKAQRELQGESKLASIAAEKEVADVQARVDIAKTQHEYNQFLNNEVFKGASNPLSGSGAVALTSPLRDETGNTTTGVKGEGNTNAITGQSASVTGVKGNTDPLVTESNKHGIWTNIGAGASGSSNDGFQAENDEIFRNMSQKILQDVEATKVKTESFYNVATTQMEYQTQMAQIQVDTAAKEAEAVIDAATAVEKNWLKVTQTVENWVRKFDERMNDVGLNIGMWRKESMSAFKEGHLQTVKDIAQKYGKSEEQIVQYQNMFAETSGRNKLLGGKDLSRTAALGTLVGDDAAAAKYISEMEFFNQSAADAADTIFEDMKNVNKLGLNARKYMKDVTANLKLANKYNFKEGTKSLREMVKWAQQTKFNMQSLSGMLEKVQEGGIEGVITQSAGFQVLGGMAAINSDPLGMLYDAWSDPQAYAKRMQDMTKGFGTFNKKTGETEFNMPESMQIAQIAKLQGRSPEELREEIARRNQTKAIKDQLNGQQKKNFNEDQLAAISNAATYDKNTGRWKVNMLNHQTHEIESKDISEIDNTNIKDLVSEDHDQKMEQMVGELVSLVAKERGEQTLEMADQAAMDYKKTMDELNKRLVIIHNDYILNRDKIHKEILQKQREITDSTKNFLDQFATNIDDDTSKIAKETDKIRQKASDITSALQSVAQTVNAANEAINKSFAEKLENFQGSVDKAASNANAKLQGNKQAQEQANANNRYQTVMKELTNNVSSVELKERIDNYNKAKQKYGALNTITAKEADKKGGYREALDLGTGNKEILNLLKKHKLITHDATSDLTPEELETVFQAMEYLISSQSDLTKSDKKAKSDTKSLGSTNQRSGGGYMNSNMHFDAVMSGNGKSMYTEASEVTSIKDGSVTLAQTHPEDTGIFAKTGGPFDKLFEGVFGKISAVYDTLKGEQRYGTWREISQAPIEKYGNLPQSSKHEEEETYRSPRSNSTINNNDINVNINGKLTLDSGNQSVDVMNLLRTNPDLVRRITELIILQLSNNENGGKHDMFSNRYYR